MNEDIYEGTSSKVEFRTTSPKPASKLPVDEQSKYLSQLHEALLELESRLTPVLTPTDENKTVVKVAVDTNQTSPVLSPVANRLYENNMGLDGMILKVQELISRIEC